MLLVFFPLPFPCCFFAPSSPDTFGTFADAAVKENKKKKTKKKYEKKTTEKFAQDFSDHQYVVFGLLSYLRSVPRLSVLCFPSLCALRDVLFMLFCSFVRFGLTLEYYRSEPFCKHVRHKAD